MSRTAWQPEITDARRKVLRAIVVANSGCTARDVLREAKLIHEAGDWPQASWTGARNEPYYGGVSQMLDQLWYLDCVEGEVDQVDLDKLQANRIRKLYVVDDDGRRVNRFYPFGDLPKALGKLLPQADERERCEALIRRFQHESGLEMVLGVGEDAKRLVRIGTPRGIVDWPFDSYLSWEAAITVAASEVGCNL